MASDETGTDNPVKRIKKTTVLSVKSLVAFCCLLGVACLFAGNALGLSREAFRMMEERAERGDVRAQKDVAAIYDNGEAGVVAKDSRKAAQWYRRCAEQGNARCQAQLGRMYAEGSGVPQDEEKAFFWIDKAAKGGDSQAREIMRNHGKTGGCLDQCEAEGATCLANCETTSDNVRVSACRRLCIEAAKPCGNSCRIGHTDKQGACLSRAEAEGATCLAKCETISDNARVSSCRLRCRDAAKSRGNSCRR